MFEQILSSNRQKTNGCSLQQLSRQNLGWFFVLTQENVLSWWFHWKAKRKSIDSSKKRS